MERATFAQTVFFNISSWLLDSNLFLRWPIKHFDWIILFTFSSSFVLWTEAPQSLRAQWIVFQQIFHVRKCFIYKVEMTFRAKNIVSLLLSKLCFYLFFWKLSPTRGYTLQDLIWLDISYSIFMINYGHSRLGSLKINIRGWVGKNDTIRRRSQIFNSFKFQAFNSWMTITVNNYTNFSISELNKCWPLWGVIKDHPKSEEQ